MMKKLKFGDIIIVICIIAVAVSIYFFDSNAADTVIVEADGKVVKTLDIEQDCEYIYKDKYTNIITVKDGQAYVSHSDCPDLTCVYSGKINDGGKIICCLPNSLIIRIETKKSKVDVISG